MQTVCLQEQPRCELVLVERFVPIDEEAPLLARLQRELPWEQRPIRLFGREIMQPRLTCWVGDPGAAYTYSATRHEPLPWSEQLMDLRRRVERATHARFNSVLCNWYRDGQDSMGWHADDEPELGNNPTIASLSFGAPRRFLLRHRTVRRGASWSCRLGSGALLVMSGATQHCYRHAVPKARAVGGRINLTFRLVRPES